MWYLAIVVKGIESNPFTTGRHVYVSKGQLGRVRVIGAGGATAIITGDEARKRLKLDRTADGELIRVRKQIVQDAKWQKREARRFDGRPQRIVA